MTRQILVVRTGQLHKVTEQVTNILLANGISDHAEVRMKGWLDNRIDELVEFRKPDLSYDREDPPHTCNRDGEGRRPMTFLECCPVIEMPRGLVSRIVADWGANKYKFDEEHAYQRQEKAKADAVPFDIEDLM